MSAVSAIRVFLADDHAIVRSGLRLLLERERDLERFRIGLSLQRP